MKMDPGVGEEEDGDVVVEESKLGYRFTQFSLFLGVITRAAIGQIVLDLSPA